MQIKKYLLMVILFAISMFPYAQTAGVIRGTLTIDSGDTVPTLSFKVQNTSQATAADKVGFLHLLLTLFNSQQYS